MGPPSPDQRKKYALAHGVPRISPFTAYVLSTLILLSIGIASVVWHAEIKALLQEAHVDYDEGDSDSIWHRQRQFITAEEEEVFQSMLAQKLERLDQEDDTDSDFLSSEGDGTDGPRVRLVHVRKEGRRGVVAEGGIAYRAGQGGLGGPLDVRVVPMQKEGYRIDEVEREGRYFGYRSNEKPIKVLEHQEWKLQKNETWMQAPNICPGKPSMIGIEKGGPSAAVRAELEHAIDLMSEGKVQLDDGDGGKRVLENRCLFLTRDCARLDIPYGGPQALRALNTTAEEFEELRKTVLMDLKPRSLGSCALVGNSQNLLKGHRGKEIDGHDTIFRHNTPVKGFQQAIGRRAASVVWVKSNYMKQSGERAELMYDLLVGLDRLPRTLLYKGKPLLIVNKGSGAPGAFSRERARWYRLAGGSKRKHPTGGFARTFNLLASGLCTRVDLYGFSFQPTSSGKYFDKKKVVIHSHMPHLEHWVYRYLMQKGKLCVYGD